MHGDTLFFPLDLMPSHKFLFKKYGLTVHGHVSKEH